MPSIEPCGTRLIYGLHGSSQFARYRIFSRRYDCCWYFDYPTCENVLFLCQQPANVLSLLFPSRLNARSPFNERGKLRRAITFFHWLFFSFSPLVPSSISHPVSSSAASFSLSFSFFIAPATPAVFSRVCFRFRLPAFHPLATPPTYSHFQMIMLRFLEFVAYVDTTSDVGCK